MQNNTIQGFEKTIKNYQKNLELKVLNIYILEANQKQVYIDIIQKIDDIDLLFEIDHKLSQILKKIGELTLRLLAGESKEIMIEFFSQVKNIFDIKEQKTEIIDLSEIDENINI